METKTSNKPLFIGLAAVAAAVAIGLTGFFSGVRYQKSQTDSSLTAVNTGTGGPETFQNDSNGGFRTGGPMGGANSSIGAVTAVAADSITVKNTRTNESKTYAIVGTTQITKDGTLASYSDITTDSTVLVTADSANTSNALRIEVDPSLGGGPSGPQNVQMN